MFTYNLWNNRLGADRQIAGKTILLNSEPYVIFKVGWGFTFAAAAYNLVLMRSLAVVRSA